MLTDYEGGKFDGLPNVTSHQWANEQAGFLAGVAAATTTETGTVGFLGAVATDRGQEEYRAGFEAGVESIDPDIKILAAYLADFGYRQEPYDAPEGARYVADLLYDAGADVIFHVAGRSGVGVLDAAGLSAPRRWAIGSETDHWQAASTRQRAHVLTSIVNGFDVQMYGVIEDYLAGSLEAGAHRLTVADGMITYAPSGDALSTDARANLDRAIEQLASGRRAAAPSGRSRQPEILLEPGTGTGFFGAGATSVRYAVPPGWEADEALVRRVGADRRLGAPTPGSSDVANIYTDPCQWVLLDPPVGPTVDDLVSALQHAPAFDGRHRIDVTVDGFEGK